MLISCSFGSAWWDTRYKKIYVTIDEISEWLIFSWWIFSLVEEFEHGGSTLHGQAYNCFSLSLFSSSCWDGRLPWKTYIRSICFPKVPVSNNSNNKIWAASQCTCTLSGGPCHLRDNKVRSRQLLLLLSEGKNKTMLDQEWFQFCNLQEKKSWSRLIEFFVFLLFFSDMNEITKDVVEEML